MLRIRPGAGRSPGSSVLVSHLPIRRLTNSGPVRSCAAHRGGPAPIYRCGGSAGVATEELLGRAPASRFTRRARIARRTPADVIVSKCRLFRYPYGPTADSRTSSSRRQAPASRGPAMPLGPPCVYCGAASPCKHSLSSWPPSFPKKPGGSFASRLQGSSLEA